MENFEFKEHSLQNTQENLLSKFNINNSFQLQYFSKIVLMFIFNTIQYEKSKILIFFLIMEMLTGQLASPIVANKQALRSGIRKGSIVGCKVTLRQNAIFNFLENAYISLPRLEAHKGILLKNLNNKEFSFQLNDLYMFYTIELHLNVFIKQLELNILYNTSIQAQKAFLLSTTGLSVRSIVR